MYIRAFKIWYSNSVFESTTGSFADWLKAPDVDVQEVMFYFPENDALGRPTRLYARGNDFYALTPEMEFTTDFDDISKVKGHIKYGKWTTWENHERISNEAINDYGEGWLFPRAETPSNVEKI